MGQQLSARDRRGAHAARAHRPGRAARLFVLVVAVLACVGPPRELPRRPHVLLICVDDLRLELSALGSWIQTPALDRLAARGVLFAEHHVQVPTCGASRYALLSGRHPVSSGVTSGNQAFVQGATALDQPAPPGAPVRSLPEAFRRAGWRCVQVGKVGHAPDGRVFAYDGSGDGHAELAGAWDEQLTPSGPWQRGWGAFFAYAGGRHREDGSGYAPLMEFEAAADDELPDGLLARRAVERLAAQGPQDPPLFLALGFYKPHLPFVATVADWQAVQSWEVPPPSHPEPGASRHRTVSGELGRYQAAFSVDAALDTLDQLQLRRAYAACVRSVDRQLGRVLDALDRQGLADSTLVVLWGDHGWQLGESGLWGKHVVFGRSLRSPLIIAGPGVARGVVSRALAESTDVAPTLLELCGLDGDDWAHPPAGASLASLLRAAPDGPVQLDSALSFWGAHASLTTARWQLLARRGAGGGWRDVELYDRQDGPDPVDDVAARQPEVLEALLALLDRRVSNPSSR